MFFVPRLFSVHIGLGKKVFLRHKLQYASNLKNWTFRLYYISGLKFAAREAGDINVKYPRRWVANYTIFQILYTRSYFHPDTVVQRCFHVIGVSGMVENSFLIILLLPSITAVYNRGNTQEPASTCQSATNCAPNTSHAGCHRFAPAQRRHVHSLVRKTADTYTRPALTALCYIAYVTCVSMCA